MYSPVYLATMPGKKTILIIDDSNTNLVLLEAILSTKGFSTFSALSVEEARPLIHRKKPDLILLDLLMPGISGFEFLEEVRLSKDLYDIPIIIVSALNDDQNVEKTMEMGAAEYIKKPVNIYNLVSIVEKTLDKFKA